MRIRPFALCAAAAALLACGSPDSEDAESANNAYRTGNQRPYPSYIDTAPQGYSGPKFKLSQNYPNVVCNERLPWDGIDFRSPAGAKKLLLAARDYCFEGFIKSDPQRSLAGANEPLDEDFRPETNEVRHWYHMPYLHVGSNPREAIHGMTRESDQRISRYNPDERNNPDRRQQNWGAAFYNAKAAAAIGKYWQGNRPAGGAFEYPEGSVIFKLLFTEDPELPGTDLEHPQAVVVPWLQGSPKWTANIHQKNRDPVIPKNQLPKQARAVRLVQMDIAIKVSYGVSPTGWIFGSLVYNRNAPEDVIERHRGWGAYGRVMPVGLSFGNDPNVMLPEAGMDGSRDLRESVYSIDIPDGPASKLRYGLDFRSLGVGGRVNGPGDNPKSSCLSCHTTARWNGTGQGLFDTLFPNIDITRSNWDNIKPWFVNLGRGQVFRIGNENAQPLDTSLQLQIALVNFRDERALTPPGETVITPLDEFIEDDADNRGPTPPGCYPLY